MIVVRTNRDGSVDEVVADVVSSVHLEQLDDDQWSLILLDYSLDQELHVTITPKRGFVYESKNVTIKCTDASPDRDTAR